MAEQRLSKLQKWVLINCYKVTVLRQREDKVLSRCRRFDVLKCRDNVEPHEKYPHFYNCKTEKFSGKPIACPAYVFTQFDIYLNFHKIELSKRKSMYGDVVYFKHKPESEKIYVSTSRSLKKLREKALIHYSYFEGVRTIILTDLGIETAKKLLRLNPTG